jgi:NAD+ kinase
MSLSRLNSPARLSGNLSSPPMPPQSSCSGSVPNLPEAFLASTPPSQSNEDNNFLLLPQTSHPLASEEPAPEPVLIPNSYCFDKPYSLQEIKEPLPSLSLKSPKSFSHSRERRILKNTEEVPRQTILKALASRPSLLPMALNPNIQQVIMSPTSPTIHDHQDTGLNEYAIEASAAAATRCPPPTAKLGPLSPCFYHTRFDNTVNFDRVLEEIAGDEYRSHSRLMQTALGVREVARQLQRRTCKTNVKNVMIVTKARDNELVTLTREVAYWLLKTPRYGNRLGVNVYVDKKLRNSKRFNAKGLVAEQPEFEDMLKYWTPDLCWSSPESFDLVLTLGGDGTVLFTSWLFQRIVPPILSFSLGSLGFLTNFKFDLYREILDKVLTDGVRVNMRMRFTCTVYREENGKSVEKDQFEVLNGMFILLFFFPAFLDLI